GRELRRLRRALRVLERVRLRQPRADGERRRAGRPRLRARAGEPPRRSPRARSAPCETSGMKRKITRFIERTLAITGALLIAFHLFFEVSTFTTGSMAPLLMGMEKGEPDTVLVEKRFTRGRAPARFQVVAFTNDDGVDVAKRVVGLPGETIQVLRDRTLLIDGRPMKTPVEVDDGHGYVGVGNLSLGRPFKVPPG